MSQIFKYVYDTKKFTRKEVYAAIGILNSKKDNGEELTFDDEHISFFTKQILNIYIKRCESHNFIDFSGLIYKAIELLENSEEIRNKLQNNFKYITVDESQDTNVSQYRLINLLGNKWKNIMLVGDPDQSIYRWRNARYQNVLEFIETYENCKVLPLAKNYRSTPEIIQAASDLIKFNKDRIQSTFETDNKSGNDVQCYEYTNNRDEAYRIADKVNHLINNEGWSTKDIVILYRVNAMSEPLEQAFSYKNIPYKVIGGYSFYDRKEIRDCCAMLKFLTNKKDFLAFQRISFFIKGLGATTVKKIEELALQDDINLLEATKYIKDNSRPKIAEACQKFIDVYDKTYDLSNASGALGSLIEGFKIEDYLNTLDNSSDRINNVNQMIEAAALYNNKGGVISYLQQISLMSAADKDSNGTISLMTIHSSKGLEFPIVFIIGINEGILPHAFSIQEEEIQEERRLLYVGISRAQKQLYLTYVKFKKVYVNKILEDMPIDPSRFLTEMGFIEEKPNGSDEQLYQAY